MLKSIIENLFLHTYFELITKIIMQHRHTYIFKFMYTISINFWKIIKRKKNTFKIYAKTWPKAKQALQNPKWIEITEQRSSQDDVPKWVRKSII